MDESPARSCRRGGATKAGPAAAATSAHPRGAIAAGASPTETKLETPFPSSPGGREAPQGDKRGGGAAREEHIHTSIAMGPPTATLEETGDDERDGGAADGTRAAETERVIITSVRTDLLTRFWDKAGAATRDSRVGHATGSAASGWRSTRWGARRSPTRA